MNKIWRPWVETPEDHQKKRQPRYTPYGSPRTVGNVQHNPQFKHPVRLLWTKAVYDYMYASGESLLRNFPVQATIQVVDWSDSSDDEDDVDLEECREEENENKSKQ